jgi:predicted CXXCH cytochrome family protein
MKARFWLVSALAIVAPLVAPAPAVAQPPAVTVSPDDVHVKAGIKCEGCHAKPGPDQFTSPGPANVAALCAQCHVREAELYLKSPKKAIFENMQLPACVTCHTNHSIVRPMDTWLGLTEPAICVACHVDGGPGSSTITSLREHLDRVAQAVDDAGRRLGRAEVAGMLVDDGHAALREARQQQVLARLSIHAFAPGPITEPAGAALKSASTAAAIADAALEELQLRRRGLAVATIVIIGFLITLWIKIRRLPKIEP